MLPFWSTLTTLVSLLLQVTPLLVALLGLTVTLNLYVPLGFKVTEVGDKAIEETSTGWLEFITFTLTLSVLTFPS